MDGHVIQKENNLTEDEIVIDKKDDIKNNKVKLVAQMILSFAVPCFILMLILAQHNIKYGGENTLLTYDMREQYMPFLANLRYLVRNPKEILFNWNYCYGGNYIGVYSYYLASPLNLITIFWKLENFNDAIYVLYLLKTALCGVTFNILLLYKSRRIEWKNILFSTCYALMSYNIAYGMCYMWTDAIILLPIVVIGVDLIFKNKRGIVYFVSMTLLFFSNYYMSFFVGVFIGCYFVTQMVVRFEKTKIKYFMTCIFKFFGYTVLALSICMPVILPTLINLKNRAGAFLSDEEVKELYDFSAAEFLKCFLPSQYTTLFSGAKPYIFCGLMIVILAVLYFFQKTSLKRKISNIVLLSVILSGFLFQKIDWIWHGLRYPTGYPYRYAFLFSFMIILMAYESFIKIEKHLGNRKYVIFILSGYTFVELFINGSFIIGCIQKDYAYDSTMLFKEYVKAYTPVAEKIKEEKGFYRVASNFKMYTDNINAMFDVHGTDFFSSANNGNVSDFLDRMGNYKYDVNLHMYSTANTPVIDSLLGIKYRVGTGEAYGLFQKIYDNDNSNISLSLFQNPNVIDLGVLRKKEQKLEIAFEDNPFVNQMKFLDYLGVADSEVFSDLSYYYDIAPNGGSTTFTYKFTTETTNPVFCYLDVDGDGREIVNVYLDGQLCIMSYANTLRRQYGLGSFEPGTEHTLTVTGPFFNYKNFYLSEYDYEKADKQVQMIMDKQLYNIRVENNHIYGCTDGEEDAYLFTSLPYDEGFKVYVDGKKTKCFEVLDTFLCFEVPGGEHQVEIVFIPKGCGVGLLCFGVGIVGVITLIMKREKK